MPLNLAILMILVCENDKRTPGVFKVLVCHAEFEKTNQSGLLHRQMSTVSSENEKIGFLLLL